MTEPQTITPERQQAASQIGQVFNSLHAFVSTLQHKNDAGQALTTTPLEYARKAIEEASFWAIKHVLMYGMPPAPKAADEPPTGADAQPPTTPTESV